MFIFIVIPLPFIFLAYVPFIDILIMCIAVKNFDANVMNHYDIALMRKGEISPAFSRPHLRNCRTYGTSCRLSVCLSVRLSSVMDVL